MTVMQSVSLIPIFSFINEYIYTLQYQKGFVYAIYLYQKNKKKFKRRYKNIIRQMFKKRFSEEMNKTNEQRN